MTKRWLSLLLVLMLAIPTFGMSAMAADTDPKISITPDDTNYVSGTRTATITSSLGGTGATIRYTYGLSHESIPNPSESEGTVYEKAIEFKTPGTYIIKAIAYKAGSVSSQVIQCPAFEVKAEVTGITISPKDPTFAGRGEQVFKATVAPASAEQSVIWWYDSSTNGTPSWQKITAAVTALTGHTSIGAKAPTATELTLTTTGAAANVQIAASLEPADDGKLPALNGKSLFTVTEVSPSGIDAPDSKKIATDQTYVLKASVTPDTVSTTKWAVTGKASDATATVVELDDEDPTPDTTTGVCTFEVTADGAKAGETTIELKTSNGLTKTVKVTVTEKSDVIAAPVFDAADGFVFTDGSEQVVNATSMTTGATIQICDDLGASDWATSYTSYDFEARSNVNKTVTLMARARTGSSIDDYKYSEVTTATFTSAVEAKTVSAVAFDDNPEELKGTEELKFTAVLASAKNGVAVKDQSATFTSSNTAVATVDYDPEPTVATTPKLYGIVKAVAPGTAVIKITSGDGKASVEYNVKVAYADVAYLEVTKGADPQADSEGITNDLQMNTEEVVNLVAKTYDDTSSTNPSSNQSVTWTSDPAGVVSIEDGKVTGLKAGNALVTVTSAAKSTIAAKFRVYVNEASKSQNNPVINPATNSVPFTGSTNVTITGGVADAAIYYTDDGTEPTVASKLYSTSFAVTKTTTIKAMSYKLGYKPTYATATLTFEVKPTGVTLDKNTANMIVDETLTLVATVAPEDVTDKTVAWESSNPAVASVDAKTGLITAKTAGITVITAKATADAAKTATCVITVTDKPLASLTIVPSTLEVYPEYTTTLSYSAVKQAKGDPSISWKSSDSTIATVNASGEFKALKAGTCVITLKYDNDTAECAVTVKAKPAESLKYPTGATYTASNTSFTAEAKSAAELVIGKLAPKSGETIEQLMYYVQFKVNVNSKGAKIIGDFPDFSSSIKADGTVVLNVPNVGEDTVVFDYTVVGTGINGFAAGVQPSTPTQADNKLSIVPVAPEKIAFEAATVEPIEGFFSDIDATATLGTVTNFEDLKTKGYTLTVAASEKDAAFTAAIDDKGVVTLAVKAPKAGKYSVNVTISATGLADVVAGPVTVNATNYVIALEDIITGEQFMYDNQTWTEDVSKITNISVLAAAGFVPTAAPEVYAIDGDAAVAVLTGWTAEVDELGMVSLTAVTPVPGKYEARVIVSAANASTGETLADVKTAKLTFTVNEEGDAVIETETGFFAYNAAGELVVSKADITAGKVKFIIDNGRTATWTSSKPKYISVGVDGQAKFTGKIGKKKNTDITATYTDKNGEKKTVSVTVRVLEITSKFKFKVSKKSTGTKMIDLKGTVININSLGSKKLTLTGKHGPEHYIEWTAFDSVDNKEIIKVTQIGKTTLIQPQADGTCQLMVTDFTGTSTLLTINVGPQYKDVETETAKVVDIIDIG